MSLGWIIAEKDGRVHWREAYMRSCLWMQANRMLCVRSSILVVNSRIGFASLMLVQQDVAGVNFRASPMHY